MEIIRGVERVAREQRVGVMLTEFGPRHDPVGHPIGDTLARRPACVVTVARLSQEQRDELQARDIPFVVFDPTTELPDDVPYVGATNWAGGRSAPRHLIELGHRRIAMISGHDRILCCRARLDGYRSALEVAGLRVDTDLVIYAELTRHDGRVAALRLLRGPERPTSIFEAGAVSPTFVGGVAVADVLLAASVTAVIAYNDMVALGLISYMTARGVHVPQDVSVVGFANVPTADLVTPPPITVCPPKEQCGRTAVDLLVDLLNEANGPATRAGSCPCNSS